MYSYLSKMYFWFDFWDVFTTTDAQQKSILTFRELCKKCIYDKWHQWNTKIFLLASINENKILNNKTIQDSMSAYIHSKFACISFKIWLFPCPWIIISKTNKTRQSLQVSCFPFLLDIKLNSNAFLTWPESRKKYTQKPEQDKQSNKSIVFLFLEDHQ